MQGWIKRVIGFGAVAVMCVYAVAALRGPRGMSALFEKRREIQLLQDKNADLRREISMKKNRIERLKHDPNEQGLEIRRQLKLLKPGETSFILPESPKAEATPVAK